MAIYIFIFCVIIFLSIYDLKQVAPYKFLFHLLIGVVILFFAGLRLEVGSDWLGYKDIFERTIQNSSTNIEFGFLYLIKLFSNLSINYNYFTIFIFFISFLVKFVAFRRLTKYVGITLLIYFSTILIASDMNQIRQGISMAFCLLSICYILNGNFLYYFLFLLLAVSFHYTAIVFLPAFWIARFRIRQSYMIIVLIILLVNFYLIRFFILDNLGFNGLFVLSEGMVGKYSTYLESENGFDSLITILNRFLVFTILLFYARRLKEDTSKIDMFVNLYFASIVIYLLLSSQGLIASRLSSYYKLVDVIFLPYFIFMFKSPKMRYLTYFLVLLYSFFYLYRSFQIPENGLIPYKNILF